ncbi:hypothetical protein J6590_044713 [Homalodisca vitripennis]|nr:hypothetical protein J6590_044713 [Homalodisca vitripennis]
MLIENAALVTVVVYVEMLTPMLSVLTTMLTDQHSCIQHAAPLRSGRLQLKQLLNEKNKPAESAVFISERRHYCAVEAQSLNGEITKEGNKRRIKLGRATSAR